MWWLLLPRWAKAAISGALVASLLVGLALAYVERERRQAATRERQRIETEAFRDRVRIIQQERARDNEIETIGDDDLLDRLRRWVRPTE